MPLTTDLCSLKIYTKRLPLRPRLPHNYVIEVFPRLLMDKTGISHKIPSGCYFPSVCGLHSDH